MNFQHFESWLRRTANRFGIDISRYRPETTEAGRLATMLATHEVNLVLDVGANVGQFASTLRNAGYSGRLLSFEPLAQAHSTLLSTSKHDHYWDVAPRVAVGDHEGEMEIHIAGNSVSSSALGMLAQHSDAAAQSAYVGTERVRVSRLDRLVTAHMHPGTIPFLKIDTQGYEDRVLDGAEHVLKVAQGVQLELSLVPLYEGQKLFDALRGRMLDSGFSTWAIRPGFCDPRTGRMLQVDATFFRD